MQDRELFGCGYDDRYRDRARVQPAPDSTWALIKSCPEWCFRSPLVQSVAELLPHWRMGGLGNALDLPIPLADYLTILDGEHEALKGSIE